MNDQEVAVRSGAAATAPPRMPVEAGSLRPGRLLLFSLIGVSGPFPGQRRSIRGPGSCWPMAALMLGFFSNLFAGFTHYGTAPAPILFGSGHVALGTWWKVGAIVRVVNLVIWLGVGGAWWKLLGIW